MPFCPECGYEYRQGFDMCTDCEAKLVDHLSEEHFEGELVEIYTSYSYSEAGMVKEILHNDGIFAGISNEFVSTLYGQAISEMSQVRVFVSDTDEKRARSLVEDYVVGNPLDVPEDCMACSHCGARVDGDAEVCPYCAEKFDN